MIPQLYHTRNLFSLEFSENYENIKLHTYEDVEASLFEKAPDHRQGSLGELNPLQKKWGLLKTAGPVGATLESWQEFCAEHGDQAIFPYCLWWLSSIYKDASELLTQSARQESEILRSLGAEISQALARYPLAPAHLKAMASHLHESFIEGATLVITCLFSGLRSTITGTFKRLRLGWPLANHA